MRALIDSVQRFTWPLLPEDYLELLNPMWAKNGQRARIERIEPETADAVTITLRPAGPVAAHAAGQYLRIGVEVNGVRTWRSYSITSAAHGRSSTLSVTVKAVPQGLVSSHLVERAAVGDVVHFELPAGDFRLPEQLPQRIAMVAAGSGVTPLMGMIRTLALTPHSAPRVDLVLIDRTAADQIFSNEFAQLVDANPWLSVHRWHTGRSGRPSCSEITGLFADWQQADTWMCGPGDLLDDAQAFWLSHGVADKLHVERFTTVRLAGAGQGGVVRFDASDKALTAAAGTTLLEAGEDAGVLMPHGCRMGICHGCVVPLVAGRVSDIRTGQVHGEPGQLIQTCINAPAGAVTLNV